MPMRSSDEARLSELRKKLLPPGTRMIDVPFNHKGITVREYEELRKLTLLETAIAYAESAEASGQLSLMPVASARDNYGWRSLPSGSRFIG